MAEITTIITQKESRLIKAIASKIYHKYCSTISESQFSYEGLYHEGVLGLLDAKKKFSLDKNVDFHKYAAIRIRGQIKDAIRGKFLVKVPQEPYAEYKLLCQARELFQKENGRNPSPVEVAKALDWKVAKVHTVSTRNITTLQAASTDSMGDGDTSAGIEYIIPDTGQTPETQLAINEIITFVGKCVETLKNTSKLIFFGRRKGLTLNQLCGVLGEKKVSAQRVQQIAKDAEQKIKGCLESYGVTRNCLDLFAS